MKLIAIKRAKGFKKAWKNDCSVADYVTVIMHSGANSIGVSNDAIANDKYVKKENIKKVVRIKKLKHIKLKELRLFCCNAGLKDEKNNVARTFKKYNNINKIYTCDGSVSFSGVILKHITRYPDYYIFGIRARLAYNQKGFYNALNYIGAKKRKPTGFYWIY